MIKIDEIQIENKLKNVPREISEFVSTIYINPILEEFIGRDIEDYELITTDLADAIVYFVLGFLDIDKFKVELAEILYLEGPVEIQKAYDAINKFVLSKLNNRKEPEKNKIDEIKLAESNHISHVEVLSEIENPTPSINTTTDFQKQIAQTSNSTAGSENSNTLASPSKANASQTNTLNTNPSLHSSDPSIVPYTNPALHIASKLDQNLEGPSSSLPKDVYVSKKPDPYHEPVEI